MGSAEAQTLCVIPRKDGVVRRFNFLRVERGGVEKSYFNSPLSGKFETQSSDRGLIRGAGLVL